MGIGDLAGLILTVVVAILGGLLAAALIQSLIRMVLRISRMQSWGITLGIASIVMFGMWLVHGQQWLLYITFGLAMAGAGLLVSSRSR